MTTTNIAMAVEYYGADFYGWQRQDNVSTVQQAVEKAASYIADEPIKVICSGRTDAGVHATYQIVNFKTTAKRDEKAWTLGLTRKHPIQSRLNGLSRYQMIFMHVLVLPRDATVMSYTTTESLQRY